jgi:hypothetical protein
MFSQMLRLLFGVSHQKNRKTTLRHLFLETLEQRCVPASSTWKPPAGAMNPTWNDANNWTNGIPGVTQNVDTAVFDGQSSSLACKLDIQNLQISTLTINANFSSLLNLNGNTLKLSSGAASSEASGTIDVAGGSLQLTGGTFAGTPL